MAIKPHKKLAPKFKKLFKLVSDQVNMELPAGFQLDDRPLWPRIKCFARKVMKLCQQHRALMDSELKGIMCAVRTIRNSKRYRRKNATKTAKRLAEIRALTEDMHIA